MKHLDQSELVLHYYGEDEGDANAAAHLAACPLCLESYQSIERVLGATEALDVPEPADNFEAALWARIDRRVRPRQRVRLPVWGWRLAAAAAWTALAAIWLFTGRLAPNRRPAEPAPLADSQAGERVLRVAVGDYLDRSQMVLLELANTDNARTRQIPWSVTRDRASDLVSESRLYRQTAEHTGDVAVAHVLDDLDRVLLDIAHGPDQLSPRDLDRFQQRLDAQGILFKIRVLSSNMQKQAL
ncbi:MAG: hypothetical protein ABSH56_03925 [Bryobacteraceae bacterium]|jgi:hypothetical protein